MDRLAENVLRRVSVWRARQKERQATIDPVMKEKARKAEYNAARNLADAVDLYEKWRGDRGK